MRLRGQKSLCKMAAKKNRMVDGLVKFAYNLQYMVLWTPEVKLLIVWLIFLLGSFVHDFFPLPASYFSNKKNLFNVIFVKKGWGWTCGLSFLFISMNVIRQKADIKTFFKCLMRLVYGTLMWFALTTSFEHIENWTGHCEGDRGKATKLACSTARSIWKGFDISGHCFLLTFCILLINSELEAATVNNKVAKEEPTELWNRRQKKIGRAVLDGAIDSLSIVLTFLMIQWEIMLFFTCTYFHTVHQKLLGTIIGMASWYLIYKVAVQKKHPLMPIAPINYIYKAEK